MHIPCVTSPRRIRTPIHFILLLAVLCAALPCRGQRSELDQAYLDMYDLNFTAAHTNLSAWITKHPDDPMGPVSDAAAYLFSEFDRLGVLDIELFANDDRFEHRTHPRPDPNIRGKFRERTDQAERLTDKLLAANPRDANSLLARTLVCGLRSDYAALIDKSDLTALRWSKEGSRFAQRALQARSDLYDAHLATGIENYMLSLKPAPVRWMIHMAGAGTSRQTGIRELKLVAERGHYLAPFARLMLAVAALRDGNRQEASTLLDGLASEFPHNTLYRRQADRIQFARK